MDLTTDNVISLYTPLAGLAMLAFWVGVLTQKIAGVITQHKETNDRVNARFKEAAETTHARLTKIEDHAQGDTDIAIQVGVLAAKMGDMASNQAKVEREIAGIQRTLSNMMTNARATKRTPITEFKQFGDDDDQ